MQNLSQSGKVVSSSLISVKPSGYKRPFFYIHGADGHTIDTVLGRYIDRDRPFYGLQAVGRDGKEPPHTCVEEMANFYIQEIRIVQPKGPYLLGGRCTGGNIALEMAQQLKKLDEEVLLVVMVDTPRPLLTEEEKLEYLEIVACEQTRRRWRETLISKGSDFSQSKFDFNPEVFRYGVQIPANYIPQIYLEHVVYFVAQENGKNSFLSKLLEPDSWNRFVVNKVEVHEVPGDHLSMTKEPNVHILAKELSACLDRADHREQKQHQNQENFNFKHNVNQNLEEKGYTVIDFLTEDQVQNLLSFYQRCPLPTDAATDAPYLYRSDISADTAYRQLVAQEIKRIFTSNIEALFSEYEFVYCNFIGKEPSSPSISIHQDPSIVDETSLKSFIVWCPLLDVTAQTGCLQVVSRSHLITSDPRPRFVYTGSSCSQDVVALMRQDYLTTVPMQAGQALVFDGRLFHGSSPNLSANERVAVTCHIAPQKSLIHFCYRESSDSSKVELFEVDDKFYEQYITGQKPEDVKSLGFFDYKISPLTPEQLVEFMNAPNSNKSKKTRIKEKLLSLFNLLRGSDWWFYKIPPLLAIAYAEILLQSPPPQTALATLLALLASMFFVAAYGHVINDIFDVEVDLQAGKHNQIATLSNLQRILLCIILAGLGFLPWLFIGFTSQSAILLAAIYILLTIYSAPPLRLKERDIWGVITDAAQVHAVPTLLVATVFSHLTATPQPQSAILATVATAWAFLAGIRGILLHQIWDRDSDLSAGVTTLVTRIGIESAEFGIRYFTFPVELLLLSLLVLAIAQFAPSLLIFCALYILVRTLSTKSGATNLDPAPAQKKYIVPHDFYEVWLPISLLVLLAIQKPLFLSLMGVHIGLFYPGIAERVAELNLLLRSSLKWITSSISLEQDNPDKEVDSVQKSNFENPNTEFIESSSNELERGLERAIGFLEQNQLDDGEFQTNFDRKYENPNHEEELVFDSSPFITSLVLYSLSFLKYNPSVKQVTEKGLSFLQKEMELGGLWRYWSSKNEKHNTIPPDLDDICCISYVLKMNNVAVPRNIEIILENRNRQGRFYTWVLPRSIRGIALNFVTLGKSLSYSNELWKLTDKDDICSVVNANVLLYLGETQQTQSVVQYLVDTVLSEQKDSHLSFYHHKLDLYYMLSRAYFAGVYSLGVLKIPIVNEVLSFQKADGSFGDELLTSLAVCTLLNFNHLNWNLDVSVEFLLKAQQADGSWRRISMYGGQLDKKLFGSAELTTAFCVEALARYHSLDRGESLQQDRAELQQVQAQLQQTEQELAQSQFQLQTTQTELIQSQSQLYATQSELQMSQTESAQLNNYLQQTQGVMSYYRFRIASNPDNIQLYHQALEVKPDDTQIHLQLGNALVRQNCFADAIATYQTALQFHPDDFEIHFELAKTLEKAKRWDEAIAAYQRAIELNPNHALAHQHLGNALADRGQLHEASVCYRRALLF